MLQIILVLAITVSLVGCEGIKDLENPAASPSTKPTSTTTTTTTTTTTNFPTAAPSTAPLFDATNLTGDWAMSCLSATSSLFSSVRSYRETLNITAGDYTASGTFFSDNFCQSPFLTLSLSGPFTLGDRATDFGGRKIDLTYARITLTARSASAAGDANGLSYCGITTWMNGVETDAAGRTCNGMPLPQANQVVYDIIDYTRWSATDQTLKFGDRASGNGSTPATRPTRFPSISTPYSKQ